MSDENVLERARRSWNSRRFDQVIKLLEPQIFQFRDEPKFYRFLAAACLKCDDWNGAKTYLERLDQLLAGEAADVKLALAACLARTGDWTSAISTWLGVLDQDQRSIFAKRGLVGLRQALAKNQANLWVRSPEFLRCVPPLVIHSRVLKAGPAIVVFGLLICAGLGAAFGWQGVQSIKRTMPSSTIPAENSSRPGPSDEHLGTLPAVQNTGLWSITLTPQEARQAWMNAQKDFQAYRDSLARQEVNKILLSNASQDLKEKARGLIPFLKDPDFTTFHDNLSYSVVRQNPDLYEGCAVRWRGVVANLLSGKTKINFDLLLGYQDGQVIEGIVPVQLKFAALLRNSQVLDVLGIIEKDPKGIWRLRGVAIHEVGYRVP